MREVLDDLMQWWESGETIGVGTVVATFQSAPRPPGASMLVGPAARRSARSPAAASRARSTSSASRWCESGEPVLERYGVSDDDAFAVGLTCGGILDVYVEKVNQQTFPELGEVAADIEAGRPVALATVIEHPDPEWVGRRIVVHPEAVPGTPRAATRATTRCTDDASACSPRATTRPSPTAPTANVAARACASSCGRSRRRRGCWSSAPSTSPPRWHGSASSSATTSRCATRGPSSRPTPASRPPTRWWSAGRTSTSRPRARPAASTGARSSACSPTTRSSTYPCSSWRCGCPRWPTSARWARVVRTRTGSPASARSGVTDDELARLSSPIGLDLGARTPEETAVSIAAEIIAGRWGGTRRPAVRRPTAASTRTRAATRGTLSRAREAALPAPGRLPARCGGRRGRLRVHGHPAR